MKEIDLSNGHTVLVDDQDYLWLTYWTWSCLTTPGGRKYAVRRAWNKQEKKYYPLLMHRAILEAGPDEQVDHANNDTLDNRRFNLRLCTQSQNNANQLKKKGATSCHKGVYWDKSRGKWMSRIKVNRKTIFLGRYNDEDEAGAAYDLAAVQYFGEFARLNFPENTDWYLEELNERQNTRT